MTCYLCQRGWCGWRASMSGMVGWVACQCGWRGWHAYVGDVLEWVAWGRASVSDAGGVLTRLAWIAWVAWMVFFRGWGGW